MTKTLDAVFDGEVLRPTKPLALKPNTHVRITIQSAREAKPSFLRTALSLNLDGPPDWSANVDKYLHGNDLPDTPKKDK